MPSRVRLKAIDNEHNQGLTEPQKQRPFIRRWGRRLLAAALSIPFVYGIYLASPSVIRVLPMAELRKLFTDLHRAEKGFSIPPGVTAEQAKLISEGTPPSQFREKNDEITFVTGEKISGFTKGEALRNHGSRSPLHVGLGSLRNAFKTTEELKKGIPNPFLHFKGSEKVEKAAKRALWNKFYKYFLLPAVIVIWTWQTWMSMEEHKRVNNALAEKERKMKELFGKFDKDKDDGNGDDNSNDDSDSGSDSDDY